MTSDDKRMKSMLVMYSDSVRQYQSTSDENSSMLCSLGEGVSFHVLTLNYQNPSTCLKKISQVILSLEGFITPIPCWPQKFDFAGLAGKPLRRAA